MQKIQLCLSRCPSKSYSPSQGRFC